MTKKLSLLMRAAVIGCAVMGVVACASSTDQSSQKVVDAAAETKAISLKPADKFDLSHWNITLPTDKNRDGKVDQVRVSEIQNYAHPEFFYLNDQGYMVFASPNKALTTKNSSNTRSELRYMSRGANTKIKTKSAGNNFALKIRPDSDQFGSIGGKMEATLHVDHVSKNAGHADKFPAYSAVIGQIHAVKYDEPAGGYGYGNEPLKIYYKKFPDHENGSVFWTYEKNLAKEDPKRKDVAYPVWGNTWDNPSDPGVEGIALGEEFGYTVNVHENTMYLTFESATKGTVQYTLNLANNVDAYGNVDPDDHKFGYAGDAMYFKAGIYNQCSTKDDPGFWYAACPGTGDWAQDYADGNYAQSTFSRLVVGPSTSE